MYNFLAMQESLTKHTAKILIKYPPMFPLVVAGFACSQIGIFYKLCKIEQTMKTNTQEFLSGMNAIRITNTKEFSMIRDDMNAIRVTNSNNFSMIRDDIRDMKDELEKLKDLILTLKK